MLQIARGRRLHLRQARLPALAEALSAASGSRRTGASATASSSSGAHDVWLSGAAAAQHGELALFGRGLDDARVGAEVDGVPLHRDGFLGERLEHRLVRLVQERAAQSVDRGAHALKGRRVERLRLLGRRRVEGGRRAEQTVALGAGHARLWGGVGVDDNAGAPPTKKNLTHGCRAVC